MLDMRTQLTTLMMYFALACHLLWPAVSVEIARKGTPLILWGPKPIQFFWELKVEYVQELKDWKVIPYTFISPARIFVEHGNKLPAELPDKIMMQLSAKKPIPLIEHAANCSFWTVPIDILQKIVVQEYAKEVDKELKRPALVVEVIKIVLKCSDALAADILEEGIAEFTSMDEDILDSEEVVQCVDETDRDKVTSFVKGKAVEKGAAAEISSIVQGIRIRSGVKERKPVGIPKNMTWAQEEVAKLLPPLSTILRDQFNGRWRVWYGKGSGTRWSHSVSWGPDLDDAACAKGCLIAVWSKHTAVTGEKCHIRGLM